MLEQRKVSEEEADVMELSHLYMWIQLIIGRTFDSDLYDSEIPFYNLQ